MGALTPAHAALGAAMRELRRERGIAQEALALSAGLNRGYYGDVERGERNVSLGNILKITRALDVRPSELFARAETIDRAALR